jgi:hypothetical protein
MTLNERSFHGFQRRLSPMRRRFYRLFVNYRKEYKSLEDRVRFRAS